MNRHKMKSALVLRSVSHIKPVGDTTGSEDTLTCLQATPELTDFAEYLPWACKKLLTPFVVVVHKIHEEIILTTPSRRRIPSRRDVNIATISKSSSEIKSPTKAFEMQSNAVEVVAIFDNSDQLLHLKFGAACGKLTSLIRVISLIIQFHPTITSLTFSAAINEPTWSEIQSLIEIANITDLCFDGCRLETGNYFEILEGSQIRTLSLARCSLDDKEIKPLMLVLCSTEVVSETLTILNLSSNRIGDLGAKYIAEMLRFNRKLSYLNLADNYITDDGFTNILDAFVDFDLTESELNEIISRKVPFLTETVSLIGSTMDDLRHQIEHAPGRASAISQEEKGKVKFGSKNSSIQDANIEDVIRNKAEAIAKNIMGDFADPIVKLLPNSVHAMGNDSLAYLNIAYNHLSYLSIKKILEVLKFQAESKSKGLYSICIEGNNIPMCVELDEINKILQTKVDDIIKDPKRRRSVYKVK